MTNPPGFGRALQPTKTALSNHCRISGIEYTTALRFAFAPITEDRPPAYCRVRKSHRSYANGVISSLASGIVSNALIVASAAST